MIKLTLADSDSTLVWINPHLVRFCIQNHGDNARVIFGPSIDDFLYVREDVHYVVAEIERATKGEII